MNEHPGKDHNHRKANNHEPQAEEPTTRQAAMIDLLEHLLADYWQVDRQGQEPPQLLPGEIPGQLPVEVPIPDGSRIVGSVLRPQHTTIVYDCALEDDQVVQFYDQRLRSQGWIKPDLREPFGRGGFTYSTGELGTHFCFGERGPFLYIRSFTPPGRPTSVQVMLNTDPEQSPCSPRQRRQAELMAARHGMADVFPQLRPPTGATQLGGGASGGGDNASSEAWLQTDLDLAFTASHYGEQLGKAGWMRVDIGQSGPIAWSTWDLTFEDETWHGMLTITKRPWSTGDYRLRLYAEAESYGQHGGIVFASHF